MLDTHAAVISAIGVQARVSVTSASPTAGQPVTISSTSVVGSGQTVTYLWAIVSAGTTGATITGPNNDSTVTVTPTAAGTFTVSLTTTDNNGFVSSATTAVGVAAAAGGGGGGGGGGGSGGGGGGGGGGGALGAGWLLGLLSAVLVLGALGRVERRRAARVAVVSAAARRARRG